MQAAGGARPGRYRAAVHTPTWIDNHCHLDGEDDPAAVVAEARADGVTQLVCVGTTVLRSAACVALAASIDGVFATAGVHPHDAVDGIDGLAEVVEAGRSAGVLVAIGECGLDHHYDHSPPPAQSEVFAAQVRMAHELGLPLVIHTREAWEETFAILDREGVPARTVFHCFTGGPDEARECLARGALLSISGIVTFPSATGLRSAVADAPLGRLMVETDSPYLAPVPFRGKRNRPALVARVGEEVAALQHRDVHTVASTTVATTRAFYGLPEA
jgi:TatD DNase family protein